MTLDEMVDKYRQLRDAESTLGKQHDEAKKAALQPYKDAALALELRISTALDEMGVTSAKTANGTAFFETKRTVNTIDADKLLSHAMTTGEFGLLVIKARVKSVNEYVEAHGDVPPGTSINSERVVRVRK